MTTSKIPQPSEPLGPDGDRLWRAALHDFCFSEVELIELEQAAREADLIHELEAELDQQGLIVQGSKGQPRVSPLVAAIGAARLRLSRLIRNLDLPDLDEPADPQPEAASSASAANRRRASNAARARWAKVRAEASA